MNLRYVLTVALSLLTALHALAQLPCERLASLKLADATVTASDAIAAGEYKTQEPAKAAFHVPASRAWTPPAPPTHD
mgnify:CR=1 FL=1